MRRLFGTSLAHSKLVVTAMIAATSVATACGGQAINDGGGGHAGSSAGSSGVGGTGGAGAAGAAGGGSGGGGSCPTTLPYYGTGCAIEGQTCSYPNGPCCPATTATCTNRTWSVPVGTCKPSPPMACPGAPPANGSPCEPASECSSYPLCTYSCPDGSPITAQCAGSTWSVSGVCPSYDGGTSECSAQLENLTWFASLNKSCTRDVDCTILSGACSEGADYCDGSFYMNRSTDTAMWNALVEELWSCYTQHGLGCAVCDGMAPPPMCVNAVCQAPLPL